MQPESILDPALGVRLTITLSWILIILGLLKLVLFLVGEFFPNAFANVKSAAVKKFLTGTGNRLLFGLGGFATALIGFLGLLAGRFLEWFFLKGGMP